MSGALHSSTHYVCGLCFSAAAYVALRSSITLNGLEHPVADEHSAIEPPRCEEGPETSPNQSGFQKLLKIRSGCCGANSDVKPLLSMGHSAGRVPKICNMSRQPYSCVMVFAQAVRSHSVYPKLHWMGSKYNPWKTVLE
ncbi:hypothetical protein KIN20_020012 [Parelaphostrongylus tenuis]|uniref:Uncharacterized protein n=1 Tax=Parelaphostrongylus tenuis TaxID=148309 RepID=A0AAD5N613_PARTN|nr:hypothetical protein KIN20_020012 [Parelaphostrongylus tenuis]